MKKIFCICLLFTSCSNSIFQKENTKEVAVAAAEKAVDKLEKIIDKNVVKLEAYADKSQVPELIATAKELASELKGAVQDFRALAKEFRQQEPQTPLLFKIIGGLLITLSIVYFILKLRK